MDLLAHARTRWSPPWGASTGYRVFVLLSMLSGEIYLRLKRYLVVKISSDIVTEHCCQVCVLSMMFCRSDCRLCAAMVVSDCAIRKLLAVPRGLTLRQANMGYEKYYLHLIFPFYLNRYIDARIIPCRISIKEILRVDSSCRACNMAAMLDHSRHRGELATKLSNSSSHTQQTVLYVIIIQQLTGCC